MCILQISMLEDIEPMNCTNDLNKELSKGTEPRNWKKETEQGADERNWTKELKQETKPTNWTKELDQGAGPGSWEGLYFIRLANNVKI